MCARIKITGVFVSRDDLIPEARLMRADGIANAPPLRNIPWGGFVRQESAAWWVSTHSAVPVSIPVESYHERSGASVSVSGDVLGYYIPKDPHTASPSIRILTRPPSSISERIIHSRHPVTRQ